MKGKFLWSGIILTLLTLVGWIGVDAYNEEITNLPVPPINTSTGWSEQPIPVYDTYGIASIDIEVKWNDEDVWMGIAPVSEKEKCSPINGISTCGSSDVSFVAGGPNHDSTSFDWQMEEGIWYAVIGDESSSISGMTDAEITAHISTSPTVTLVMGGISATLLALGVFWRE